MCREAGARVTTNVFIRDLDLAEFSGLDGRSFVPRRPIGHRHNDGVTLPQRRHHEARSCSTCRCGIGTGMEDEGGHIPGIGRDEGRARLVVLAAETGGRWSAETAQFLRCLLGQGQRGDSNRSDAEQGQGCLVEEVEQHPGVQCSKGFRIVPS